MQYVIFGAGKWGSMALSFLGIPRVQCFIDNYRAGTEYCGKETFDFESLLRMDLEEIIVVIASRYHYIEMEMQLKEHHIQRYFLFYENHLGLWTQMLPFSYLNKQFELVSYNRLLTAYDITKYRHVAILGANELVPYLISEIAFHNRIENLCEVIKFDDDEYQTLGIECTKWNGSLKDIDCLIINCPRCQPGLDEVLGKVRKETDIIDLYDADLIEPSFYHPELKKYKDMCKGKRVFVIGSGPSLTIEDLNKLHQNKEICIASNKMYRVYDQTDFRADFYVMEDQDAIEDSSEDLKNIPGNLFIGDGYHVERPNYVMKEMQYFHTILAFPGFLPNYPKFSSDFSKGLYRGGTVTYSSLQLAVYLGAREIYLLGIDHSYVNDPGAEENHFIKNYLTEKEKESFRKRYKIIRYEADNATKAYEAAEIYSRSHGFRIYNATRGGRLEAFERVDLDRLFKNESDLSK